MAAALAIISVVFIWTAGFADWIVAYSTGVAQLGIWLTLFSLLPVASLWVSLKRLSFNELPVSTTHAHWSVHLKISLQKTAILILYIYLNRFHYIH